MCCARAGLAADAPFDFIVMDCPPSLGILMANALAAADELLVPIQCEYFALEGLSKIVGLIEQVKASGANPNLRIGGIVMTMFDGRTNLSNQVVGEVKKHFEATIYQTCIPALGAAGRGAELWPDDIRIRAARRGGGGPIGNSPTNSSAGRSRQDGETVPGFDAALVNPLPPMLQQVSARIA